MNSSKRDIQVITRGARSAICGAVAACSSGPASASRVADRAAEHNRVFQFGRPLFLCGD
jgi:hypothetical protein